MLAFYIFFFTLSKNKCIVLLGQGLGPNGPASSNPTTHYGHLLQVSGSVSALTINS
jgi:hypothetical protein